MESTAGVAGTLSRKQVGTARCGVRTVCSPPPLSKLRRFLSFLWMVAGEVTERLAKPMSAARLRAFKSLTIRACVPQLVEGPARDAGQCWFESSRMPQISAGTPTGREGWLKPSTVSVRIGPGAPIARLAHVVEARGLNPRTGRVRLPGRARVGFPSADCKPAG